MVVKIDLVAGRKHRSNITQKDIQKNIDALDNYKNGIPTVIDTIFLIDTLSILEGIKEQLPKN